ncbi:type III-B CRISPR module-associated protein Cmr5 [Acanthopleuribacter pedis]|uniref:CRISPR type III-B/RAMP module-associated protein Cmr5 n=1 Tax=Acanthopleuribacter pedis TaxID=442870 RepID=A0A8J7Q0D1_9BACT|nr:type III-B CRISPR module-associated protein Cmr5 [Acanthopleuribacter pedis]MBO1318082.1 type III-B CRISPR module-associated protein Cmr5 [Acanthopleuribacter pedis]
MKTLAQDRASDALRCVKALPEGDGSAALCSRYRAYVERLGPAILINGLGQAVAGELAAAGAKPESAEEKAHQKLVANLSGWLCRDNDGVYPHRKNADGKYLLQQVIEGNQADYTLAQAEAIAWLTWHKKFCRAAIPTEAVPE